MLLVESEARRLVCPQSFAAPEAGFRHGGPWNCVGSNCAAWRWMDVAVRLDRRGYCGLAGVPKEDV